jgi:hypothetical protein
VTPVSFLGTSLPPGASRHGTTDDGRIGPLRSPPDGLCKRIWSRRCSGMSAAPGPPGVTGAAALKHRARAPLAFC